VDDARLVERCLRGDAAGIREFVERFQDIVFGFCLRMLGQREDAEDVTQETLVRAVRHMGQWDPSRPLQPWVLAIAVNRCRTWASKRKRAPLAMDDASSFVAPRRRMSVADLSEELTIALNELREEYRVCFVLFYQQELSCQQIADLMNCPVATIKTWLRRARHELAETLRRRGVVTEQGHELHGI
jgi:RNA polymerase sigma-70 factor (ECF subfamily)